MCATAWGAAPLRRFCPRVRASAFLSLVCVAAAAAGAGISGAASVTDGDTLKMGAGRIRLGAAAGTGNSPRPDPATTGPRAGRRCGAPPARCRRQSRSGAPRSTAGARRSRGIRRPPGASPGNTPGPCRSGRRRSPEPTQIGRPRPGSHSRTVPPTGGPTGRHERPTLTWSRAARPAGVRRASSASTPPKAARPTAWVGVSVDPCAEDGFGSQASEPENRVRTSSSMT